MLFRHYKAIDGLAMVTLLVEFSRSPDQSLSTFWSTFRRGEVAGKSCMGSWACVQQLRAELKESK